MKSVYGPMRSFLRISLMVSCLSLVSISWFFKVQTFTDHLVFFTANSWCLYKLSSDKHTIIRISKQLLQNILSLKRSQKTHVLNEIRFQFEKLGPYGLGRWRIEYSVWGRKFPYPSFIMIHSYLADWPKIWIKVKPTKKFFPNCSTKESF